MPPTFDLRKVPRRFRRGTPGTVWELDVRDVSTAARAFGRQFQLDHVRFNLEVIDKHGRAKSYVPVELRTTRVPRGVLDNGDTVVVRGRKKRRGVLHAEAIYVWQTERTLLTTEEGCSGCLLAPIRLLFALIWLGGIAAVVAGIVMLNGGDRDEGGAVLAAGIGALVVYAIWHKRSKR